MRRRRRSATLALLVAAIAALSALLLAPAAGADTLPERFEAQTVFSGLKKPVNFKFAPDGRVFVATQSGKIYVYDSVSDPTPTLFANLSKQVYDYQDHGLLGLAIDPGFDVGRPFVYALYTFNHELTDKATQVPLVTDPQAASLAWPEYKGPAGSFEEDKCPEGEEVEEKKKNHEPAVEELGCEVSGLLVRLTANLATNEAEPSPQAPSEKVLLEGWCQQSTTHSIGDLGWGPEGALFVSGGEGAMFSEPDYGQFGNPCEDPVELDGEGHVVRLTAEGGSLRSQSVRRDPHDAIHPTLLSGTLLRVDPNTGNGWPGNPFSAWGEPNAQRIYSYGFRNPWRFAFNYRTGNIFLSNVGNGHFEEMDRIPLASTLSEAEVHNSGWPCYEGGADQVSARNLEYVGEDPAYWNDPCKPLFEAEDNGEPKTAAPFYAYANGGPAVPGDPCSFKPTDIAGLAFYEGADYPAEYKNSLFFSDAIRGCIYVIKAAANGEPDPATATTFLSPSAKFTFPGVDIQQGPEGNVFYAEYGSGGNGAIKRIVYNKPSEPPPDNGGGGGGNPPPPPVSSKRPAIKQRPAKKTKKTTAKFVFSGEPGQRFRCKIDGKGFSSCRSPRTYKHLKVGKHSFRVYATDSTGARLSSNRVFQWRIVKSS